MASRAFSRSKISILASGLFRAIYRTPIKDSPLPLKSKVSAFETDPWRPVCGFREYHDGRPRGPLWRGKKLIGKEALFVILGLKRFKDDEEKLQKFIKTHVLRLLKMDMFAVLIELERQEEVALAIKCWNEIYAIEQLSSFFLVGNMWLFGHSYEQCRFEECDRNQTGDWSTSISGFFVVTVTSSCDLTSNCVIFQIFNVIRKQDWYKPDVYLYKDLIIALARCKKMDDVMGLWESMRADKLFLDSQTYAEVIRGFLSSGSPGDAMNIYEDMKKSPDPPEELPFRILLKGLLPHPLLRNRVKQDFEELFPEKHMYDPPEEIFGAR
ncbi:hypothetical protein L484_025326 [Morus notabilis]|uniref:Pentatricopeptide repeat-containing protein n=1 Tax=Morus notabilis TaxID=981085 RepID=W9S2I0_9ROSA|nr:hypothetical protein L484_025326 [Morus notabilis]